MDLPIDVKIESLLFWKGEPVMVKELAKMLSVDEGAIQDGLKELEQKLIESNRGISLVREGDKVLLTTHSEVSEIITALNKEELIKDLSKATLETLSIVLYRGPIKRSEIDYIRGVNSQFTLRTLSIRGLIDRKTDPKDERAYVYTASIELLQLLGVAKKEDLPDFESVNNDIEGFMSMEEVKEDNEGTDEKESNESKEEDGGTEI